MKTIKILLYLVCILYAGNAFSETVYVSGIMKITLRTGPGNDNKIVEMLQSGDGLKVLQSGKDWSLVETGSGNTGWVLTRLTTSDKPDVLLVAALQKENIALREEVTKIRDLNKILKKKNSELSAELNGTKTSYDETSRQYEDLKSKSGTMFQLEKDHKLMTQELQEKTSQVSSLDSQVKSKNIKLFLYGAGVLVVGLIFGLSLRREKKHSKIRF
jgi:SH3 domain protein